MPGWLDLRLIGLRYIQLLGRTLAQKTGRATPQFPHRPPTGHRAPAIWTKLATSRHQAKGNGSRPLNEGTVFPDHKTPETSFPWKKRREVPSIGQKIPAPALKHLRKQVHRSSDQRKRPPATRSDDSPAATSRLRIAFAARP